MREPREVRTIEEMRQELVLARLATLDNTYWVYLCTAQTGAGKSYADIEVIKRLTREGKKSVTLAPNHQHCQEIVAQRRQAGIASAAFPHLNEETCARYEEAGAVIELGLSPVAVLCPDCPHRDGCPHREQYAEAMASDHKVATQPRGRVSLPVLTEGCSYLSVHEDSLDLLAPTVSLHEWPREEGQRPNIDRGHPLLVVGRIADQAAEVAADPCDRGFYRHLASVARYLDAQQHGTNETAAVPLPKASHHEPRALHRDLHDAVCDLSPAYRPPREAMQLAVAAALGKLRHLCVQMNEYRGKGGAVQLNHVLTGVGRTELPAGVPVVLSDHTADLDDIRTVTSRPPRDITPPGALPLVHPVLQVCPKRDVNRTRNVARAADVLRGVMHDLPQFGRVGLLTHQTLYRKVVGALGEPYAARITLAAYFGDGLSRGSNEWLAQCDVLIILGTPRPGTPSIRNHLVRLGKLRAARLTEAEAGWHRETWTATTESGKSEAITTGRYRDDDWHRAYCSIAKAQLKQAIGRGRGILPAGIPVFVVSTENMNDTTTQMPGRFPLADAPFAPLTPNHVRVLRTLEGTSAERRLMTGDVSSRLDMGRKRKALKQANGWLTCLLEAGRVRRKGRSGGWYLPPPPAGG